MYNPIWVRVTITREDFYYIVDVSLTDAELTHDMLVGNTYTSIRHVVGTDLNIELFRWVTCIRKYITKYSDWEGFKSCLDDVLCGVRSLYTAELNASKEV